MWLVSWLVVDSQLKVELNDLRPCQCEYQAVITFVEDEARRTTYAASFS